MTAVTAIFDPSMPDETSISLFYNTSTAQLAVALKNGSDGSDPDGKGFEASETDHHGFIVKSSHLASGSFRGFRFVVGVTEPKTESFHPTASQISIVSPVYQGIASTALESRAVAVSQSDTNSWVYFLDGTKDQVRLKEIIFSTGQVTSRLDGEDVAAHSSLGAWYDLANDERYVVYQQGKDNHLREFNAITLGTHDIVSTSDAKPGTSIAVTIYQGKVYLYYADASDNVRRVTKNNGQWESSQIVRDSLPVGKGQMTVTPANNIIHLFYVSRDDASAHQRLTHLVEQV